ncbi:universal stress protein [Halosquirtibacter laminarini]|uniref:Universal stress protein n=1 Tax=Halosquirtibacter laminarini TaxID=3374600 RepID=A0AC61NI82_9BACT|nr:universal stress protein [Prolixibacteraceae bacterium]
MEYKCILIAVDGSVHTKRAADKGVSLAKQLNAAIVMVSIIDHADVLGDIDSGVLPEESKAVVEKSQRAMLKSFIDSYPDTNIQCVILEDNPEEAIVRVAEEVKADMIVIGGHQKGFVEELFTLNIRKYILSHTRIPLMVVPS